MCNHHIACMSEVINNIQDVIITYPATMWHPFKSFKGEWIIMLLNERCILFFKQEKQLHNKREWPTKLFLKQLYQPYLDEIYVYVYQ